MTQSMKSFVGQLLSKYAAQLDSPSDPEQAELIRDRLNSLRLANAVLTKLSLNRSLPDHLPQIAILGPTQSGKSTLVNLLAGSDIAGVSPLAGYTVHAQGFSSGDEHSTGLSTGELFADFEKITQQHLDSEILKAYSLESVGPLFDPLPPSVLWDSPDFDSVESRGYRSAVLRVAALADVLVLMVSKDKYADKAVWDMLTLLKPLNKPTLVCINKLSESDTTAVLESFNERHRETFGADSPLPQIIPIPYVKNLDSSASQMLHKCRDTIQQSLKHLLAGIDRTQHSAGASQLLQTHWQQWLEPALKEHAARKQWQSEVDLAITEGVQRYRDGYLEHPQKYDTFNRALAELLTLLEVPGLAAALGKTRSVVTWPVRKLFNFGQTFLEKEQGEAIVPTELEDTVLQQAHAHIMTHLGAVILDQQTDRTAQSGWWTSLAHTLRTEKNQHSETFRYAIDQYQADFIPEIEGAAENLYLKLQEQPTLLNTLRVARVSTDAAAVVLAVKSGGLAASDLVIAPAMLSLTTMLTEGVLGKYMESVKADLKSRQAQIVQQTLFDETIKSWLYQLPDVLEDRGLFLLPEEEIKIAEEKLMAAEL